jgi:hypothetical protein
MPRLAIVTFLLACVTGLAATTGPARPLQPTVLEAKTIYISNHTGNHALTARAITELKTWGRFTVVTDPAKADLTLTISTEARSNPDSDDERAYITLQILLPHDDIPQFSYTQDNLVRFMETDVTKSIKTLRKRIDDQEKSKPASVASAR